MSSSESNTTTNVPLSPPGAAEKFFFNFSKKSFRKKSKDRSDSNSVKSVATSVYYSAEEDLIESAEEEDHGVKFLRKSQGITDKKMKNAVSDADVTAAVTGKVVEEKSMPVEEPVVSEEVSEEGVNATQVVYENAKNIWGAAAGIGVFTPFLKTAEGVANKILSVKGLDLEKVDSAVKPFLADVDSAVNPHIIAVMEAVKPIVEKIMPVVMAPVGLIKQDKSDDPEVTPSPVAVQ